MRKKNEKKIQIQPCNPQLDFPKIQILIDTHLISKCLAIPIYEVYETIRIKKLRMYKNDGKDCLLFDTYIKFFNKTLKKKG